MGFRWGVFRMSLMIWLAASVVFRFHAGLRLWQYHYGPHVPCYDCEGWPEGFLLLLLLMSIPQSLLASAFLAMLHPRGLVRSIAFSMLIGVGTGLAVLLAFVLVYDFHSSISMDLGTVCMDLIFLTVRTGDANGLFVAGAAGGLVSGWAAKWINADLQGADRRP